MPIAQHGCPFKEMRIKVKGALLDDSYFENMHSEVEQGIVDFLQSNK
jgi:hypothetical protein